MTEPATHSESTFVRRLRHYGPFGPLFLTPLLLVVSISVAAVAYFGQRNQAKLLADSVNAAALATLYSHGNDVTKALLANPDLMIFFDKYAREREGATEKDVEERCRTASPEMRNRIDNICVLMADFMEEAFARRKLHPAEDWDAWWNSFCDDYDESFPLREYFRNRGGRWYTVYKELKPVCKDGAIDWAATCAKRDKEYLTHRFQNSDDMASPDYKCP